MSDVAYSEFPYRFAISIPSGDGHILFHSEVFTSTSDTSPALMDRVASLVKAGLPHHLFTVERLSKTGEWQRRL